MWNILSLFQSTLASPKPYVTFRNSNVPAEMKNNGCNPNLAITWQCGFGEIDRKLLSDKNTEALSLYFLLPYGFLNITPHYLPIVSKPKTLLMRCRCE
jgi:hypothetical protein